MKNTMISNYRDLKIGKYNEILAISKDDAVEDLEKQVQILSILSGMTEDEILDAPISDYKEMVVASRFLERPCEEAHMRIAKVYHCGTFDLVPTQDLRRIITAQYIDFKTYCKDLEENAVDILSCFMVPKGMVYGHGYDVLDVKDAIKKEMSVADVISLYAFFLRSYEKLIQNSLISSMKEAGKIPDKEKRKEMERRIQEQLEILSRINGDGSPM